jgi:hypothetical protein
MDKGAPLGPGTSAHPLDLKGRQGEAFLVQCVVGVGVRTSGIETQQRIQAGQLHLLLIDLGNDVLRSRRERRSRGCILRAPQIRIRGAFEGLRADTNKRREWRLIIHGTGGRAACGG